MLRGHNQQFSFVRAEFDTELLAIVQSKLSVTTCVPERFESKSGDIPELESCKIQRKSGVEKAKSGHK